MQRFYFNELVLSVIFQPLFSKFHLFSSACLTDLLAFIVERAKDLEMNRKLPR